MNTTTPADVPSYEEIKDRTDRIVKSVDQWNTSSLPSISDFIKFARSTIRESRSHELSNTDVR